MLIIKKPHPITFLIKILVDKKINNYILLPGCLRMVGLSKILPKIFVNCSLVIRSGETALNVPCIVESKIACSYILTISIK